MLTAERCAEINACGRYLLVSVLRLASGDCTLGGVSAQNEYLMLPHPEGPHRASEDDSPVLLELIPPAFEGCPVRVRPRGARGTMAGGNFVYSSDSRFAKLYGAPLSIHDRKE